MHRNHKSRVEHKQDRSSTTSRQLTSSENPSMPTLLQVKSFLRAVTSGKDRKLQAERDKVCNGCDQFTERPVKNLWGKWRMAGHCKACGCGAKSFADINKGKHVWRDMTCPQLKWPGDAKDVGLSLQDANTLFNARDRLEYNLATVQNLIDKGKPMDPATQAQVFGQPQQPPTPQSAAGKARAGAAAVPRTVPVAQFNQAFPSSKPVATKALPRPTAELIAEGRAALATATAENLLGAGV